MIKIVAINGSPRKGKGNTATVRPLYLCVDQPVRCGHLTRTEEHPVAPCNLHVAKTDLAYAAVFSPPDRCQTPSSLRQVVQVCLPKHVRL